VLLVRFNVKDLLKILITSKITTLFQKEVISYIHKNSGQDLRTFSKEQTTIVILKTGLTMHIFMYILQKGDARELLELRDDKRIHTMKSLSALAKYTGCYNRWQEIRQNFQLKWSNDNSLQAFSSIFNKEKDFDHMICWLIDTCSRLPKNYANILIFNTLTGLRPSEACMAITLIHNNLEHYLNRDTQILEHFKFQEFIRHIKKAYISLFNDEILKIAEHAEKELTYNSLKWIFKRYNIPLCMSFCRKIFATYLRTQGVEQEIIDLLQGRIPRNVFVRHYYRPNFIEENKKVTFLLTNLYKRLLVRKDID
jgi:hypothetical protein